MPNVGEVLNTLHNLNWLLIVVTNQPDVARGFVDIEEVKKIHDFLLEEFPVIDDIRCCMHDEGDGCDCRKPFPGMLLQAAQKFEINLAESFMVGDRWRDIEAGKNAGCKTIYIDYGYDEKKPVDWDYRVINLVEAQKIITKDANNED